MRPNLMAHDQIVQEVFAGTGATFGGEAAHNTLDVERDSGAGPEIFGGTPWARSDASPLKSFWFSLGTCGVAGAAVIIAALALVVALTSIEQCDLMREGIRSINAGLYDVSSLRKDVQEIAAGQAVIQKISLAQSEALQSTGEKITRFEIGLRQSIDNVNQKVDRAISDDKERVAFLKLRVDRIDAAKTTLAAASDDLQPRREDVGNDAAAGQEPQSPSAFRLTRIDGDVATLDSPNGSLSVSVGENIPGLGKVSKIGKRGRRGIVVATHQTLTAPWEQVAAEAPLRLDIEHDSIDVPTMTEPAPMKSADRRKKRRRPPGFKAF